MATAVKGPPAGLTGAVRALQWTIQDLNGSVEHMSQSQDHVRRSLSITAWASAIFAALLLSAIIWVANDVFHLKDQLTRTDQRFDSLETQITALGARVDRLNITMEQTSAQLLASNGGAPATASIAPAPAVAPAPVAAAAPVQQVAPVGQTAAPDASQPVVAAVDPAVTDGVIEPSPPAPRDQLTPEERGAIPAAPVAAAPVVAPAAEPAAPVAEPETAAVAPAAEPAAAAPAAAPAGGDLSDDELLSLDESQIDPADELLLLDENGNPQ